MRALLISNSGRPFLAHCRGAIAASLGPARRVGFVSAANLRDEPGYGGMARVASAPSRPASPSITCAGTGTGR